MNKPEIDAAIQEQSKQYLDALEDCKSAFENAVTSFFTSKIKTCLVVKTKDTRVAAIRLMQALQQLKDDPEHPKALEKYLNADNQTFLSWKQLLDIVRPLENRPKFSDLLVCEFPQSLEMDQSDEQVLNKLIDRINMVASKKCVFLISQGGSLDQYIKNIDMPVFLKIDEYENTVTSMTYGDNIEALIKESSKGHLEEVKQLLEDGVEVNSTYERGGFTALETAAANGHKDIVLTLLKSEVPVQKSELALEQAASNGHKDTVLVLLENGVDANNNNFGWTPLRISVMNDHVNVVRVLLEHGADINDETCMPNYTPLIIAIRKNNIDMIKTLLNHRGQHLNLRRGTPLHLAVQRRNKDAFLALIKYIDVDTKNHERKTALHVAVGLNFNDMVDLLIRYNANVNAYDVANCTPLYVAAKIGNLEIIKALLDNGAEISETYTKYSPLHIAVENGEVSVVSLLLENKVDANIRNDQGRTALHEGVKRGNPNIVKALLKHGANVNAQTYDDYGYSPLHLYPHENLTEILQTLLDHDDIDINAKDHDGYTPLHRAVYHYSDEAIKILITRGASREIRNNYGETAWDVGIAEYCDDNILALLET